MWAHAGSNPLSAGGSCPAPLRNDADVSGQRFIPRPALIRMSQRRTDGLREGYMIRRTTAVTVLVAACTAGSAAHAQLINARHLPVATALAIAQTASETSKAQGYRVSVTVVGRDGDILVQLRGDGSSPHTLENSRRKAYTARTLRVPSAEVVKRLADPARAGATQAQLTLPNMIGLAGALPIAVGEDVIGAVGVSGAPGGERDEVCAKAGIDKVADQLK